LVTKTRAGYAPTGQALLQLIVSRLCRKVVLRGQRGRVELAV